MQNLADRNGIKYFKNSFACFFFYIINVLYCFFSIYEKQLSKILPQFLFMMVYFTYYYICIFTRVSFNSILVQPFKLSILFFHGSKNIRICTTTLSADSIHLLLCIIYPEKIRFYSNMNEKNEQKKQTKHQKIVKLCLEDFFFNPIFHLSI